MEKDIKTLTLSVEEWHSLALEGVMSAVQVSLVGDSMRPLIRKNTDTVTVAPVYRDLKKGDIVLFRRDDRDYVVHRIKRIVDGKVITLGDRCVDFDAPIPISSVWGIAVKLQRGDRNLNLDSCFCRAVGKVIMATRPVRYVLKKLVRHCANILKKVGK